MSGRLGLEVILARCSRRIATARADAAVASILRPAAQPAGTRANSSRARSRMELPG